MRLIIYCAFNLLINLNKGGETPGPIYERYLTDKEIDWSKVSILTKSGLN